MFAWIAENIVTIIICAVLAIMVAAIVVTLVKDKKKGKSSCGCKCGSCPMAGSCHSQKYFFRRRSCRERLLPTAPF